MNKLSAIDSRRIPNILLLGNGINRVFGNSSWDNLLDNISTGEFDSDERFAVALHELPYALQTVVITSITVIN